MWVGGLIQVKVGLSHWAWPCGGWRDWAEAVEKVGFEPLCLVAILNGLN